MVGEQGGHFGVQRRIPLTEPFKRGGPLWIRLLDKREKALLARVCRAASASSALS